MDSVQQRYAVQKVDIVQHRDMLLGNEMVDSVQHRYAVQKVDIVQHGCAAR